eukprot:TRINITY_DN1689_c0_g2_i1.p1 TRINITY_DN1689_c0_g2~~TRINITY_DN1689_c0_g2_i1.p1  ORF type:complete len:391 (+),score=75.51 TRINITY_DN1689_c0_g2_i1:114-1286(+)
MTSAAASITRPQRQLAASLPRLEGASNSKATNQRALKSHPPVLQNTSPRILSTVLQPNKLSPFAKQMKESSATPSERREVRFVRLLQQIQPISLTRGRLPIHYAVEHFALDDVELISQSGIDMNSKDENGNTPLMYAAGRNRVDVVRFLLRVRADATLANERGWTALHFACMNGADACILELIDAKCPLDATSVDGMTALHWAAAHGRYGCAKLLLERGAKADIATNDGKMAIHMAMRYRNDDLCVLLLENTSNWDALGTQTSNLLLQLVENALPKTCVLVLERMKQAGDVKSILQLQSARGDTMLHLCGREFERNKSALSQYEHFPFCNFMPLCIFYQAYAGSVDDQNYVLICCKIHPRQEPQTLLFKNSYIPCDHNVTLFHISPQKPS